ncbi:MAG: hypothetical protein LLF28_00445 [Nitrospiraceae bacterium]|nr:hypothetical protein [Nitrospiraceae bacterium]
MKEERGLFDDKPSSAPVIKTKQAASQIKKEVGPLERLKNLEEKITTAIEKVKVLKEEKLAVERKVKELETKLVSKDKEIEKIQAEKTAIKTQVEGLLNELENIEAV